MPVRQDVNGGITTPTAQSYQSGGAARAQYQGVDTSGAENALNKQTSFWNSLIQRGATAGEAMDQRQKAEAYLEGQQDNAMGKARSEVHNSMEEDYAQGYNRAQVGTDLAKFQLGIQQQAVQFVNAGKSPDEFKAHVKEQTDSLLATAGAQGMDLKNQDWQAWLNGVSSTRDTATDLYQTKNLERSQYMKAQSLAAEGSASVAVFQAGDVAGNPMGALDNLTAHVARVYSDPTLTPQQKDGVFADFATQAMGSARSSAAVEGVSTYFAGLPQFKSLPTQVQTQITQNAQRLFENRASDESGQVLSYVSQVQSINNPNELNRQYPMSNFISTLDQAQVERKISAGQKFSIVNEENVRRLKLQSAADKTNAVLTGTTITDIATKAGLTTTNSVKALKDLYASQNGGYSGGGLALLSRGLQSGASDIASVGIDMLQQDAQSLNSIDSRNLKRDSDGAPMYPATVVASVKTLKTAYDLAQAAGNNVQAAQLVAGLPDAVAYGIRQSVDANDIAQVVYNRADDIAAGRVVALPAAMPKEMLATTDDVSAGLFDTNMTKNGSARNTLGIQSWIFSSKEDDLAKESRLTQMNSAISEEYTSLYQQGKLPARSGDDLKTFLVGRVASRAVRIEDGTDNGSLVILPQVANKEQVFGSVDNKLIGQSLQPMLEDFRKRNPSAGVVQLRYDAMSNELVLSATDKTNTLLTTSEGIPTGDVRNSVRAIESRLTSNGNGNTTGNLAVPGVGFTRFNSINSFGVDTQVYNQAVTQLISYEGYTDQKGFSILATHPTTGATLNEAKYVKQPGDSPQTATDKLSLYLNDRVMPSVMGEMPKFKGMPEYLQSAVMKQLIETTYHAGNAGMFAGFLQTALKGDAKQAYEDFKASPLYKDAGPESRRNKDRMSLLQAVSVFHDDTSGATPAQRFQNDPAAYVPPFLK